jgi:lactoylglutathione lyase
MSRIVHLALKVDELEKAGQFYQNVFGFADAETKKTRDHTSRHMTDGEIDFALLKYDAGTQSAESKAAGDGPCIHHFAVEVEDIIEATKQILSYGCKIVSDPGVIPVKFHAPGGTVAELVPIGRYNCFGQAREPHRAHLAESGRPRQDRRVLSKGVWLRRCRNKKNA